MGDEYSTHDLYRNLTTAIVTEIEMEITTEIITEIVSEIATAIVTEIVTETSDLIGPANSVEAMSSKRRKVSKERNGSRQSQFSSFFYGKLYETEVKSPYSTFLTNSQ